MRSNDRAASSVGLTRARLRRLGLVGLVCLGSAGIATGCGSDSGGGSTSATDTSTAQTSPDSVGVQEAAAFVAAHTENPTEVPLAGSPLSKAPPSGKSIVYLECGAPNCKNIGDGIEDAATALGWELTRIPAGLTPEEVVKAWNSAITLKPDAALIAGFGTDIAARQISQFTATGAPWVGESITDTVGENGLIANVASPADFVERGKYLARWLTADSNGKANAILFNSPAFTILKPFQEAMQAELKRLCPECVLEVQNINPADVGTKLPREIVSAVRRDPSVDYVIPAFGDGALGVPEALTSAHLSDQVKLITQGAGKVNLQQVQNGQVPVFVPEAPDVEGWMMVDALARHFAGDPVPSEGYAIGPHQYLTKDNLKAALGGSYGDYNYTGVLDYADQYKALWKVN